MQSEITRKSQSEQENCERHQVPVLSTLARCIHRFPKEPSAFEIMGGTSGLEKFGSKSYK